MDGDELVATVYRKIEREKALIHAASNIRQSTDNPLVQQRVDSNIRDSKKNIAYLEEKMRELQLRMGQEGGPSGQSPPHGSPTQQRFSGGGRGDGPPPPPPKDSSYMQGERGDYGDPGPGGYAQGGTGAMPPRAPFNDPRPYSSVPKARPNFSKLGMPKYLPHRDRGLCEYLDFRSSSHSLTRHNAYRLD